MEELTIVRKRTRVWPIVILLIVVALVAFAVYYMTTDPYFTAPSLAAREWDSSRTLPSDDRRDRRSSTHT